mgnify:CR=1 FL=1
MSAVVLQHNLRDVGDKWLEAARYNTDGVSPLFTGELEDEAQGKCGASGKR